MLPEAVAAALSVAAPTSRWRMEVAETGDGVTLINDYQGAEPRSGEIRRLRITEAHDYDLVGTLLPPVEKRSTGLVSITAGV